MSQLVVLGKPKQTRWEIINYTIFITVASGTCKCTDTLQITITQITIHCKVIKREN